MPKAKTPQVNALLDSWGRGNNRKLLDKPCADCGAKFKPRHSGSKYCSRRCAWNNNGKHQERTGSFWVNSRGYMEIAIWENGKRVTRKLHRVIMEHYLGRSLASCEDVHHINGDKLDNRPCNLQVISHGEHSRHHNYERAYRSGYKLDIDANERKRRSEQAKRVKPWVNGLPKAREALAKAEGKS